MGSEEEDLKLRGFQAGANLHALGAIAQSICEREREREHITATTKNKEKKRKEKTYSWKMHEHVMCKI